MRPIAPAHPGLPAGPTRFTLDDVRVWTGGEPVRERGRLAVADGTITSVDGREAGGPAPADDGALAEFAGCTVTPGLVDLHQHLPADNALRLSGLFATLHLLHGVTTVRDAGDGDGTAVPALRRGAEHGHYAAPRVWACGPFVGRRPVAWRNTVLVDDASDPAAVVAEAVARGAQTLKLYDHLTRADIAALTEAAGAAGLDTIGHVPAGLAYETAGVRHVQHFHGVPRPETVADTLLDRLADWRTVDETRLQQIVDATLAQGLRNTPTLVVTEGVLRAQRPVPPADEPDARLVPALYPQVVWDRQEGLAAYRRMTPEAVRMLERSLDLKLDLVGRLHAAGAPLFLGTDVQQPYVVPGAALHRELRLFARAGLAPAAIWDLATRQAGAELGVPGLGTITAGAPADLLVFGEDPTRSLDALDSLRAVVAGGRLLRVEALQAMAEAYRRHYARTLVDLVSRRAARRTMRALADAGAMGATADAAR